MKKEASEKGFVALRNNYLPAIITALFLIISFSTVAQVYQNDPAYGRAIDRYKARKTLLIPTFCGVPTLQSTDSTAAGIAYDSCNAKFYVYNPSLNSWGEITGGGGTSLAIDSAYRNAGDSGTVYRFTNSTTFTILDKVTKVRGCYVKLAGTGPSPSAYDSLICPIDSLITATLSDSLLIARNALIDTANAIELRKQVKINLTTTGSSGAATFNQGTGALNIPNYAGGGGATDTTFYNAHTKFGADKTGATDASVAIQSAIDYALARGGGTVYLPAGTYLLNNTIRLYARIILMGDGQEATVLRSNSADTAISIKYASLKDEGAQIRDLGLRSNSVGTIAIYMENMAFFRLENLMIGQYPMGIKFIGSLIGTVKDVNFENGLVNVYADKSSANISPNLVTFYNCQFNGPDVHAVEWYNGTSLQFQSCDFENLGTNGDTTTGAIYYAGAGSLVNGNIQYTGLFLDGCWFENNDGIDVFIDTSNIDLQSSFTNTAFGANAGDPYRVYIKSGTSFTNKLLINGGEVQSVTPASGVTVDGAKAILVTDNVNIGNGYYARLLNGGIAYDKPNGIAITTDNVVFDSPASVSRDFTTGIATATLALKSQSAKTILRRNTGSGSPSFGTIDSSYFGGLFQPQVAAAAAGAASGWEVPLAGKVNYIGKSVGTAIYLNNPSTGGVGLSAGNDLTRLIVNNTTGIWHLGKSFFGGSTTPTAQVHIAAGTASNSSAPIKLTSGTQLTTPEAGVIETSGLELKYSTSTTAASRGFLQNNRYVSTATSLTADANQTTIGISATGQTITLPTAVGILGRVYTIKLNASGTADVATTSSQTIDGSTTYTLSAQYKYVTVQSDNANWVIIGNN